MRTALIKRKILNTGALWFSYIKLIPWLFRLTKKSIVLDCGANIGHITSYLAVTGAKIYAFEPDPVAFEILSRRCRNKKNVICINKGVWDKDASIQLFRHNEMKEDEISFTVASSIISNKKNIDPSNAFEIVVIDLVNFMQQLNRKIDMIKLDVEGAETEILKRIIQSDAYTLFNLMYVETHETKVPGQKAELAVIKQYLKQKGITNIKLNWI
jgi:FkbM family methyltransferase